MTDATVGGVRVVEMDHIVLRCADVETTLAWYTDVLGLVGVRVEEWRRREAPFPSVRVAPGTIIDLVGGGSAAADDGRLDHFCLVLEPTDLDALARGGSLHVVEGPVTRYGARGDGRSLYVRDPDGGIVELRCYDVASEEPV